MSKNKTTNLTLHSWDATDQVKRTEFNENFNKIDVDSKSKADQIGSLSGARIDITEYTGKVATSDGWDITPIIDTVISDCITKKKPLYIPQVNIYTSKPIRPNKNLDPLNPIDGFTIFGVFAPIPYNDSKMPSLIKPLSGFPVGESIIDLRYTKRSAVMYLGIDGLGMEINGIEYGERISNGRLFPHHLIQTNSIHNCKTGISASNANLIRAYGNNISGCSYVGMGLFQYCGDSDLGGNYFNSINVDYQGNDLFTGTGLVLGSGTSNTNVYGGKSEWNAKGIVVYGCSGVTINTVNFDANKWCHIYIESIDNNTLTAQSISITSNRFLSGGTFWDTVGRGKSHIVAVSSVGKVRCAITGNAFRKGGFGAYDLDPSVPVGPALYGIKATASGTGNIDITLSGNDMLDCSLASTLSVDGANAVIRNQGNATNLPWETYNGALILNESYGITNINGQSACRAYHSTVQSLAANTATKILYQTEEYDQQGEYDTVNSKFTAKVPGIYLVQASVFWGAQVDGNRTSLDVYLNGVGNRRLYDGIVGYGLSSQSKGSALMKLNAADYIEFYANTSNATSTATGQFLSYLEIIKIS